MAPKQWYLIASAVPATCGAFLVHLIRFSDGYACDVGGDILGWFLAAIVAFVFGLPALLISAWALIRRKFVRAALATIAGTVGVGYLPSLLLPASPFLLGLRMHISSTMTPDQLRAVAATVRAMWDREPGLRGREVPGPEALPYGPARNENDDRRWAELSAVPGFAKLGSKVTVTSHDDVVELAWFARETSSGVRIAVPAVRKSDRDSSYWAIEPDIALFTTHFQ